MAQRGGCQEPPRSLQGKEACWAFFHTAALQRLKLGLGQPPNSIGAAEAVCREQGWGYLGTQALQL